MTGLPLPSLALTAETPLRRAIEEYLALRPEFERPVQERPSGRETPHSVAIVFEHLGRHFPPRLSTQLPQKQQEHLGSRRHERSVYQVANFRKALYVRLR